MFFLRNRDIPYPFGIKYITISQSGGFIVRDAHQVKGIPCHSHFYIIVSGLSKCNMSGYVFKSTPIMNTGQINGDSNFGKVIHIIQPFLYLLLEKQIGLINQILMQD